jgi:hypothetical protein
VDGEDGDAFSDANKWFCDCYGGLAARFFPIKGTPFYGLIARFYEGDTKDL